MCTQDHLTWRRVATLVAVAWMMLAACGEGDDGEIVLSAWVWDDENRCWAATPGTTSAGEAGVPGRSEPECSESTSSVVAGESRVALALALSPNAFDKRPSPKITAFRSDGSTASVGVLELGGSATFIGELKVPFENTSPLSLEAELGSSRSAVLGPMSVTTRGVTVELRVADVAAAPEATFVAGLDSAQVCVCAPRLGTLTTELRHVMGTGEVIAGPQLTLKEERCADPAPMTEDPEEPECPCDCGPGLFAQGVVMTPARPNTTWQVEAVTAAGTARTDPAIINAPGPVSLSLMQPATFTCEGTAPPRRTKFETGACRELGVQVDAVDSPLDPTVPLTVSVGAFEGDSSVLLGSEPPERAIWRIPRGTSTPAEATLTASPSGLSAITRTYVFEQIFPEGGSLFAHVPVEVSDSGTAGALITGQLNLPKGGARLMPADLPIKIVVGTDESPSSAACGTTLDPELIRCDRVPTSGTPGGCILTPQPPTLTDTGAFQLSLGSGVCVAGEVTFTLFASVASDPGNGDCPCLGEREVAPYKELGSVTVEFVPAPATGSDDTEAGSTGG